MCTTLGKSNYYFESSHESGVFLPFSDTYIRAHQKQSSKDLSVQRNQKPSLESTHSVYIY